MSIVEEGVLSAKSVGQSIGRHRSRRTSAQKKRLASNIVLQVLAMLGLGLLIYPQGADWVNSLSHNAEISGYVREVERTPEGKRKEILDAAYKYNDELEPGPLTDPYLTEYEDAQLGSSLYQAYEEMLKVSGTDAIGAVNYPDVGIALPVYHGTTDSVISKGAGHLYGTSLPVGGPSTRSVLTAHSGLPQAKLFTGLHDASVGDIFWISVLGEDHHYEVREIEVVSPEETDSFRIIEGEDWVTLFTCTPIGVNSHRILVHAERIPSPEGNGDQILDGDGITAGFPWWLLIYLGGSALIAFILFFPSRRRGLSTK